MKRRNFLSHSTLGSLALSMGLISTSQLKASPNKKNTTMKRSNGPVSICTWRFEKANATCGALLDQGKPALDAVILGVAVEEENIKNTTVGKGGAPDREGHVTLDACVMDKHGNAGSVAAVENITNVAALARKVMEDTPHVMMVGEGAEQLAVDSGFTREDLLTEESEKAWKKWLETSDYKPIINIENHDTIGMVAMDANGDISGACTTSGLAYKMRGRVGDSPIIGSGLFIDNEIGGAAATGMGEEVIKSVGSFLIVELMRNGMSPQQACEEAVNRIVTKNPKYTDFQVAYVAMNKAGETGSYCIHPGFTMMQYKDGKNEAIASKSFITN